MMRERVCRLTCWDEPGTASNAVWTAAWLSAKTWMWVTLFSVAKSMAAFTAALMAVASAS